MKYGKENSLAINIGRKIHRIQEGFFLIRYTKVKDRGAGKFVKQIISFRMREVHEIVFQDNL